MSTFKLTIKLGNEAMQTSADVAEALHDAATAIEQGTGIEDRREMGRIFDVNGNTVGEWKVTR